MTVLLAGSVHAQEATAKYSWTGTGTKAGLLAPRSGNKVVSFGKCQKETMTIDIRIEGKSVIGVLERNGHHRRHFQTELGVGGVFRAATDAGERWGPGGKSPGGYGPSPPGLDDGELHVSGIINETEAEISIDGSCDFHGRLARK